MIRLATPNDLEAITRMAHTFAQTGWKHVLLQNKRQIRAYARFLITSPSSAMLVEDRAGQILGVFGITAETHPMSGEIIATESIYWVEPQARKGRTALALISAAKRWAFSRGATKLYMGAPDAKVGGFYAKLQGIPVETLYQFNLAEAP